jgi:translation initiation factor IF-2
MKLVRQPIVTVFGHVDHGKTTLLDAIRKTSVAQKEAGGITQSIGASQVVTKEGKKITFIDTPGHAAFAKMRSRGAQVADVAILVVATDAGVKPQTEEALEYIKKAKIPFLVALTKIDLSAANIPETKEQLEALGILFEGKGGDVPVVPVSAKTGKGVSELLETLILMAEVNDITKDPQAPLEVVVIETSKVKAGLMVSLLVRNGTLKKADQITTQSAKDEPISCRVRGIFDENGRPLSKAEPGEPVMVLGFGQLPAIGAQVGLADKVLGQVKKDQVQVLQTKTVKVNKNQLAIIVKAKDTGSLEALLASLPSNVVVISSGVGDINDSDIFLAKTTGQALVFSFRAKVPTGVQKLANTEGVRVESFEVIYELLERLEELLEAKREKIIGRAQVLASFPFNNKKVAGCRVLEGKIGVNDVLSLRRGEQELAKVKPVSLKKGKQKITEAGKDEEFGIIFRPQLDFKIGDMLVSVRK